MNQSTVSAMLDTTEQLEKAFNTFKSNTFTETIWYGLASDNAKSLIDEKIFTKTKKVKTKLEDLSKAITIATECDKIKSEIKHIQNYMSNLDLSNEEDTKIYTTYKTNLQEQESLYEEKIANLRTLCQ